MATHSNILACKTPPTEEPGRPQSVGLQESDRTDPLTTTMAEFQKEKNVILKCSIYVPVNTDVCIEQHAITGRAKEIKIYYLQSLLENLLKTCLQTEQ